jgi:hypothetical protein
MSSLALWFLKSKTDSVVGGTGFASETVLAASFLAAEHQDSGKVS